MSSGILAGSVSAIAGEEPNDSTQQTAKETTATAKQAATTAACEIVFGEDASSKTLSTSLTPGQSKTYSGLGGGWSFVRSTTGPCHFRIYNSADLGGSHVTYGSGIDERVRVGTDGFKRKDNGGGDTWRARSLVISYPNSHLSESCVLRIGDNGVSMNIYASISDLPLSAFVRSAKGRNCRYELHSDSSYGGARYKYAFPGLDSNFEVGYYMRSIAVKSWTQSNCPLLADTGSDTISRGRCLPIAALPSYPGTQDNDCDGVDDRVESWVASTFSPLFIFDSNQAPRSNPESPTMLYQVKRVNPSTLRLSGALLWTADLGYGPSSGCSDKHTGDYSDLTVDVREVVDSSGTTHYAPVLVNLWHHAHWEDGKAWNHSWGNGGGNRGFDFAGTHARVFLSAHKHHEYNDTGWNHENSAYSEWSCNDDVDGKGVQRYAKYVNVGNSSHRLLTSPHTANSAFYDYDFWTSSKDFCGKLAPGSIVIQNNIPIPICTGTVLKDKPFAEKIEQAAQTGWQAGVKAANGFHTTCSTTR